MHDFDQKILDTVPMDVTTAWQELQHGFDARSREIHLALKLLPSNLETVRALRQLQIRLEKASQVVFGALTRLARLEGELRRGELVQRPPLLDAYAVYGIHFLPDSVDDQGRVLNIDPDFSDGDAEIGIAAVGALGSQSSIIFAVGSHVHAHPSRPTSQRLEAKPEWRLNLLRYCRSRGVKNPPEPAWLLGWTQG